MSAQRSLSDEDLPGYLRSIGLARPGEAVLVEPLGDGNINWVRRFRRPGGSGVVKQARPALERFPEYRAPTERLLVEARYYQTVAPFDRGGLCPRVLFLDVDQRVLVLEDLEPAERLDAALARGADVRDAAAALGEFLGAVHAGTRGDGSLAGRFANDGMRRLHGDHIFHLPYRDNDFPLSPALAERARTIRANATLVARIAAAHRRYLEPRGALLHGDVQSANVLLTPSGPKLLDAEIAHVGDPAFDVGQLIGHLLLPCAARGEAAAARGAAGAAWSAYTAASGCDDEPAFAAVATHAGIELLRRAIGAARVPALASDAAGLAAVELGEALVLSPPDSPGGLGR